MIESVKLLAPHRERRAELAKDMDSIRDILHDGNKRANEIADETLEQVREAMGMRYWDAPTNRRCRIVDSRSGIFISAL